MLKDLRKTLIYMTKGELDDFGIEMAKNHLDIINIKLLAAQYGEQRKDLPNFLPFTLTLNNNILKRWRIERQAFL